MFEGPQGSPIEILKERLSQLKSEAGDLEEKILESGENIDVELGSAEYVDFGYTERLREIQAEIANIEGELQDADDQSSLQRNLNL
jgi:predicted  nucleic acid-binding Zn-ribbon protein